ncbi:uncharacterized protein LOC114861339 isoform X2 [Betta splendens]|uniref:Uncharacterized protein LOC114861339 isoform X2 n=1 Tax=Betta splendens TaxID=158456 RepID=A0A6P7NEX1_BETSP|nr:uncharacterized protein LOC114861339 isoform X2 [Betta splendens]
MYQYKVEMKDEDVHVYQDQTKSDGEQQDQSLTEHNRSTSGIKDEQQELSLTEQNWSTSTIKEEQRDLSLNEQHWFTCGIKEEQKDPSLTEQQKSTSTIKEEQHWSTGGIKEEKQNPTDQQVSTPPGDTHRLPGTATASLATAVTSVRSYDYTSLFREYIESLLAISTTRAEVAKVLGISRPTMYKLLREYNIMHKKFCNISDEELDATINEIKSKYPKIGEIMMIGHLRSKKIVVQRSRVRQSLQRIYAAGVESRRTTTI